MNNPFHPFTIKLSTQQMITLIQASSHVLDYIPDELPPETSIKPETIRAIRDLETLVADHMADTPEAAISFDARMVAALNAIASGMTYLMEADQVFTVQDSGVSPGELAWIKRLVISAVTRQFPDGASDQEAPLG